MNKTTLALASAIGAVSMVAISAVAQQPSTKSPAPAATSTTPATPAPEVKTDKPNSQTKGWHGNRNPSSERHRNYGKRMHRGHHRARSGGYGGFMPRMGRRWRNLSDADRTAFFEARIAAIRAGLMLNETQDRLWPKVESAVREMVAMRRAWRDRVRKEGRPANPMDRLKRRGEFLSERGTAVQKLAEAGKPLYDSLSDDQKRRLRILTRGRRNASHRRGMYQRRMKNRARSWHGRRFNQQRRWHRQGSKNQRGWGNSTKRWNQSYSLNGLDRGNRMADWRNL